ncbi:MAG: DNA polymerase III subunit gamma/tau [Clostridia bacterium]|nr:DNA polymerase III subunit gamma/tau [Clostridia bacterium]
MYQALYRKWRPSVFEDVVGQPQITKTLKNEIEAGRIAHAYIFTGSRGTGKTTCAKILAKAVNCLSPRGGDPCNECESCRGIDGGSVLDVVEIDAASNNGVDSIRELREEAGFTPVSAKYRVYIIDEAHMLSTGAFNALLKTLEEPPAYVIFILATTEVHKIPATILSRCQRFDFRRIPAADIERRIQYVAGQEHLSLSGDAASLIARLSDGALRDALSLLDQCAAVSAEITGQVVSDAAGLSGRDYLFELSDAVAAQDAGAALRVIDRLYKASKDCERLCEELLAHFRGIMLIKAIGPEPELLGLPADELARLEETAKRFSAPAALHCLDLLEETFERLRRSASRRTELEMCLLRLCVPALDDSPAAMLRRLDALEDAVRSGPAASRGQAAGGAKGGSSPAEPKDTQGEAGAAQKPGSPDLTPVQPDGQPQSNGQPQLTGQSKLADQSQLTDEPLLCWPEVLEAVQQTDPPLSGVLNGSSAYVRGNYVLVDSGNAMFATLIKQKSHQSALVEAIRKATGESCRVGIIKKSAQNTRDPMDEIASNAAEAGFSVDDK